jgi:hypothetical protein
VRTVLERWETAPTAGQFASRSWRELAAATGLASPNRSAAPRARSAAGARTAPVERHTDADRAALERVVSERAAPQK